MRLAGSIGVSITLRALRYQFPDPTATDWYDLNWLIIAGDVVTPEGSWSFEDPCLLTTEAAQLGAWLDDAAEGRHPPATSDTSGGINPQCTFLEPNLGFGVEALDAGRLTLRAHFSLEARPPWVGDEGLGPAGQFQMLCTVSVASVHAAADAWRAELGPLPERAPRQSA